MTARSEVTLQINLCAGDLSYAEITVPALIATHRREVREVLIIADACRPQSTPSLHSPSRFPPEPFAKRVVKLRALCAAWLRDELVDRVEWIERGNPQIRTLNAKYCGRATSWSHDHLGHAFTAYFAGWDYPRTRYVLHFDADVILHQAQGFRWVESALGLMRTDPSILAVSPRIAPPMASSEKSLVDLSKSGNGWQTSWRLDEHPQGWRSDWFSTRCHLMDRERLATILPLFPARGRFTDAACQQVNAILFPLYESRSWFSDTPKRGLKWLMDRIARRIALRVIPPFPLPPEVLLYERARISAHSCIYLGDPRAWYIHPDTKPAPLVELLPQITRSVTSGVFPAAQRGFTGIRCSDWAPASPRPAP